MALVSAEDGRAWSVGSLTDDALQGRAAPNSPCLFVREIIGAESWRALAFILTLPQLTSICFRNAHPSVGKRGFGWRGERGIEEAPGAGQYRWFADGEIFAKWRQFMLRGVK